MNYKIIILFLFFLFFNFSLRAENINPPQCNLNNGYSYSIKYTGKYLLPTIFGSIDGKVAKFVFDTGSYATLLTLSGVKNNKLPLISSNKAINGLGGFSSTFKTHIKDINIEEINYLKDTEIDVLSETKNFNDFDAIIGAPFIFEDGLYINFPDKKIVQFKNLECNKKFEPIWEESTSIINTRLISMEDRNPHFSVIINGRSLDAVIDSGAYNSFITLSAARRIGLVSHLLPPTNAQNFSGIGRNNINRWIINIASLKIGNEIYNDSKMDMLEHSGIASAELFIGQDFLRSHRIFFDSKEAHLYIGLVTSDSFLNKVSPEKWMIEEAESGNGNAAFIIANIYKANPNLEDSAVQSKKWLEKSAYFGNPNANLIIGRQLMLDKNFEESIKFLNKGLKIYLMTYMETFGHLYQGSG